MRNPYSLTFGMEPKEYIKRPDVFSTITTTISNEDPDNRCFIITGVQEKPFSFLKSAITTRMRKIGLLSI